jgi:NAD+ kinase
MKFERPHFVYEESKEASASLAGRLIDAFGQAPLEEADLIVSIGGDGLLLTTFKQAEGKVVYGITPPGSNSNGFWTDHNVDGPAALERNLAAAEEVRLTPLKADIHFANGNRETKYAFGDFDIERSSGQSALVNLTAEFKHATLGPYRIMGDGLIISTPYGSTGTSRSYGGPLMDLRSDTILLTGKGVYEPRSMAPLVTNGKDVSFRLAFGSAATKRPVRIDYDGFSIAQDKSGSPVVALDIAAAPEKAVTFLATKDPGIRTFSSMMG